MKKNAMYIIKDIIRFYHCIVIYTSFNTPFHETTVKH